MSPEPSAPPKVEILLADRAWDASLQKDFIQVTVTDRLDAADVCVMRFDNPGMRYQDFELFKLGTPVEVRLGWGDTAEAVFFGEVIGTEQFIPRAGSPRLDVRAFDRLFRLMRAKKQRTFLNVKDSDIAEQIARDHGLTYEGDATSVTHAHVLQANISDWEFLKARAARCGRVVRIDHKKLTFRDAFARPEAVRTLTYEQDLPRIACTLSIGSLPTRVTVRAWDPVTKQKIEETIKAADIQPELGTQELGAEIARRALGDAPLLLASAPVGSAEEAKALAETFQREASRTFAQAEFAIQGDPKLRAGAVVTLEGLGSRLSGSWGIDVSDHRLTAESYTTRCDLSRNGWRPSPPGETSPTESETEAVDIDIVIVDALGNPMPGMDYQLHLSDGTTRQGQTDSDGRLLEAGCPQGPYRIENAEFSMSVLEKEA